MIGFQKASILKRFSAALLDAIVLSIVSLGFILLISLITNYDSKTQTLQSYYDHYENIYGVKFDISEEEYANLKDGGADYNAAYDSLLNDQEAMNAYSQVVNLTLLMISLGLFFGYLATEFIVPLIFKNGQTIGKKIFGIALVHDNAVKIDSVALFIRTILGKYAIETMVGVLIVIMIYFNTITLVGVVVLGLILLLQVLLLVFTQNKTLIHDLLAKTVAVDYASQRIFNTKAELMEEITSQAAAAAKEIKY